MNKLILCCTLAVMLCSCSDNTTEEKPEVVTDVSVKENKLDKLNWLVGTWEMQTPDGLFTETWEKQSDSVYAGRGVMVSPKGDTSFSESIQLIQSGDTLWYVPTISSQNDGRETRFKEKSLNDTEVVFENPTHDFPQRIIYKKPSDSTLYARIEGKMNGKDMQEEYQYKKK